MPAGVVLAAGLSTRLGRPKQLLEAGGRILLAHVLEPVLEADLEPVVLVLGSRAGEIRAALSSPRGLGPEKMARVQVVLNPDFAQGLASSIKAGLAAVGRVPGALFLPGDQVNITSGLINRIVARFQEADQPGVIRPRYGGRFGGPVLFAGRHFSRLMTLQGDMGGRSLLPELGPEVVPLDFSAEERPLDIDTQTDYQAWQQQVEG